jgi:NADPH:quinone reductase-like Zn-dependent oxidoreductase
VVSGARGGHGGAAGGRLVLYGWLDAGPIPLPVAADLRNRHIDRYSFFELTTDRPAQLRRAVDLIDAGLRTGAFRPVIDHVFPIDDVVAAHHRLESNAQIGRIILTADS